MYTDSVQNEVEFHGPHKLVEELETPFGDIHVRVDGKGIPFSYRIQTYEAPEGKLDKSVTIHVIDIDFSELKIDDTIFCGFENDILEYNDGDENSVLYSCESDKQILGLCAYESYDCDMEYCCFQLEDKSPKGFGYRIVSEPKEFGAHKFYNSKKTSLSVAWVNKADYRDADLVIFFTLT